MLLLILGIFWVVLGLFFLVFPERVRSRILRKGLKRVRQILFMLTWVVGAVFIGAAWEIENTTLSIVLIIIGIVSLLKGVFFLKRSVAQRIIDWVARVPRSGLQAIAGAYCVFGVGLIAVGYLF